MFVRIILFLFALHPIFGIFAGNKVPYLWSNTLGRGKYHPAATLNPGLVGSKINARFMQSQEKQPVQENKTPVVGDIVPAPQPAINMHVGLPGMDSVEEGRLLEENNLLKDKIADLNEIEEDNIKALKRVVLTQSDRMAQLLNLSTRNSNIVRRLFQNRQMARY